MCTVQCTKEMEEMLMAKTQTKHFAFSLSLIGVQHVVSGAVDFLYSNCKSVYGHKLVCDWKLKGIVQHFGDCLFLLVSSFNAKLR